MPTTRFTDRWLRSLAFDGTRREYADSTCPGLRVRVCARGVQFSALVRTPDVARRHYDRATYAAAKLEVACEIDAFVEEVERVAADRDDSRLCQGRPVPERLADTVD